MAKLFNQSTLLLILVGFLVLAQADPFRKHSRNDDDDDDKDSDSDSKSGGDNSKTVIAIKTKETGNEGCVCGDSKLKEFIHKFVLLFRAYGSKELGPELHSMAKKIIDFVLGYLAKEKPEEMDKFHNFLQGTAQVTGAAMGKRSKRQVWSFLERFGHKE